MKSYGVTIQMKPLQFSSTLPWNYLFSTWIKPLRLWMKLYNVTIQIGGPVSKKLFFGPSGLSLV